MRLGIFLGLTSRRGSGSSGNEETEFLADESGNALTDESGNNLLSSGST